MRNRFLQGVVLILALLSIQVFLPACAGTSNNPAAAPAPPIELPAPAVLKFVSAQGLTFDLAAIGGSSASAMTVSKARVPNLNATDQELAQLIAGGPQVVGHFDSLFLKPVLQGIEQLNIPTIDAATGQPTTQFTATGFVFTHAGTTDYLAGTHDVKIDFVPFDLDGDGVKEPCSGNAAVTPICVRFWLDGAPFVAGIFNVPPVYGTDPSVPVNIGAGSFRILINNFKGSGFQLQFKYNYAQGGAAPRESREVAHFFEAQEQAGVTPPDWFCGSDCFEYNYHSDVSQLGPASVSQAAADSSRFAFEGLVSSSPCFAASQPTDCSCPGGGTVSVDASENFTLTGCTSSGKVFSGTITPASGGTYNATMPAFGDCTNVIWQGARLDQACGGQVSGTCAGASSSCTLSLDAASGVCNATCDGTALPILKNINIFVGDTRGNTNGTCQLFAHGPFTTCGQQVGYIGKYVDGGGFWSGASAFNFLFDGQADPILSSDELIPCAIIPLSAACYYDADPANCEQPQASCESVGALLDNIFVDDIPYVSMTTPADVLFPPASEFPAAPPF